MRLFVAVSPPAEVVEVLAALPRPDEPSLRWTTPDQWHVTLRFLGEVGEGSVDGLVRALRAVGGRLPPRRVELGPATERLGRTVLVVPVAGLDDLAAEVVRATRRVGVAPDDRPFRGHLTLARGRGRRPVPARLAGAPLVAGWEVRRFDLVRSTLRTGGARYEVVAGVPLAVSEGR